MLILEQKLLAHETKPQNFPIVEDVLDNLDEIVKEINQGAKYLLVGVPEVGKSVYLLAVVKKTKTTVITSPKEIDQALQSNNIILVDNFYQIIKTLTILNQKEKINKLLQKASIITLTPYQYEWIQLNYPQIYQQIQQLKYRPKILKYSQEQAEKITQQVLHHYQIPITPKILKTAINKSKHKYIYQGKQYETYIPLTAIKTIKNATILEEKIPPRILSEIKALASTITNKIDTIENLIKPVAETLAIIIPGISLLNPSLALISLTISRILEGFPEQYNTLLPLQQVTPAQKEQLERKLHLEPGTLKYLTPTTIKTISEHLQKTEKQIQQLLQQTNQLQTILNEIEKKLQEIIEKLTEIEEKISGYQTIENDEQLQEILGIKYPEEILDPFNPQIQLTLEEQKALTQYRNTIIEILQQAENKIVLITAEPGCGKTITLYLTYQKLKQTHRVAYINPIVLETTGIKGHTKTNTYLIFDDIREEQQLKNLLNTIPPKKIIATIRKPKLNQYQEKYLTQLKEKTHIIELKPNRQLAKAILKKKFQAITYDPQAIEIILDKIKTAEQEYILRFLAEIVERAKRKNIKLTVEEAEEVPSSIYNYIEKILLEDYIPLTQPLKIRVKIFLELVILAYKMKAGRSLWKVTLQVLDDYLNNLLETPGHTTLLQDFAIGEKVSLPHETWADTITNILENKKQPLYKIAQEIIQGYEIWQIKLRKEIAINHQIEWTTVPYTLLAKTIQLTKHNKKILTKTLEDMTPTTFIELFEYKNTTKELEKHIPLLLKLLKEHETAEPALKAIEIIALKSVEPFKPYWDKLTPLLLKWLKEHETAEPALKAIRAIAEESIEPFKPYIPLLLKLLKEHETAEPALEAIEIIALKSVEPFKPYWDQLIPLLLKWLKEHETAWPALKAIRAIAEESIEPFKPYWSVMESLFANLLRDEFVYSQVCIVVGVFGLWDLRSGVLYELMLGLWKKERDCRVAFGLACYDFEEAVVFLRRNCSDLYELLVGLRGRVSG